MIWRIHIYISYCTFNWTVTTWNSLVTKDILLRVDFLWVLQPWYCDPMFEDWNFMDPLQIEESHSISWFGMVEREWPRSLGLKPISLENLRLNSHQLWVVKTSWFQAAISNRNLWLLKSVSRLLKLLRLARGQDCGWNSEGKPLGIGEIPGPLMIPSTLCIVKPLMFAIGFGQAFVWFGDIRLNSDFRTERWHCIFSFSRCWRCPIGLPALWASFTNLRWSHLDGIGCSVFNVFFIILLKRFIMIPCRFQLQRSLLLGVI